MIQVAGIGASAGGLEAMLPMFASFRPGGRIAYVVAQHMAHDGHSDLVTRLIQRESTLPVVLATDEPMRLQPDTIYMIPAGKDGKVHAGRLTLTEPAPENISTPSVNVLFASIAESCGSDAIGIVLSGTGMDGVNGCRAIKASGGLVLAQEPTEAKYSGMPGAAIDAGLVDRVIDVEQMGAVLTELFPGSVVYTPAQNVTIAVNSTDFTAVNTADTAISTEQRRELTMLLRQVLEATGIDFSSYKEETLLRRLEKRKAVMGVETSDAYQALIRRQPDELHTLQHLFLVSMSSFFRDRESFVVLEHTLATRILAKTDGEPVRIWVPGCASGEEPYTLAIILSELLGANRQRHPIAITATDLNPEALEMARTGIYRQTAFKEMDGGLRDRYFIPRGQHFEVLPELKQLISFEQRDVLSGVPPGSHDLVSCRNLLIYMKSHLQDRLIKSFHQALCSHGLLFLGLYESLSFIGNSLFMPVDHYHRLFCRRH